MMGVLPVAQAWSEGLGDLTPSMSQKYVCYHAWGISTRRTFPRASHTDDVWGMNGDYF